MDELRAMEVSDIRKTALELKRELMNIRFRVKLAADAVLSGKISKIKKDIARAMLAMREKNFKC